MAKRYFVLYSGWRALKLNLNARYNSLNLTCNVTTFRSSILRPGGEFAKSDEREIERTPHKVLEELSNVADVVIIGGGIIGTSIAYWLRRQSFGIRNIVVIERDPMYTRASSVLAAGGIRTQFSLPENIKMSLFTIEFLKNIKEYLSVEGEDSPDIQFWPQGYLLVSESEDGARILTENHSIQKAMGANTELLSPLQLESRFPWINTKTIKLASYGLENEGWFDPWSLLQAFQRKAKSMGVKFIHGNVTGFRFQDLFISPDSTPGRLKQRTIKYLEIDIPDVADKVYLESSYYINCAGSWSANIAKLLKIGDKNEDWPLKVPLPVEKRKRYIYYFHCPEGPGLDCPFFIDPSGVYFRREGLGGNYICGKSPTIEEEEPDISELDVDYDWFDDQIWPTLARWIPSFEKLKVKSGWAGYYDYNTIDQNGIIGFHPTYPNFYIATGFSGHGLQQAPAVGRYVAEQVAAGMFDYKPPVHLDRLGFTRFIESKPLKEKNIV